MFYLYYLLTKLINKFKIRLIQALEFMGKVLLRLLLLLLLWVLPLLLLLISKARLMVPRGGGGRTRCTFNRSTLAVYYKDSGGDITRYFGRYVR